MLLISNKNKIGKNLYGEQYAVLIIKANKKINYYKILFKMKIKIQKEAS